MTRLLFSEDFEAGLDNWIKQALEGGVSVVDNPLGSGKALKSILQYDIDYSNMGFGNAPRAEIARTDYMLQNETAYRLKFKTFLPLNFQLESTYTNRHSFFQIHSTSNTGSPQLSLQIDKNNYVMTSHSNFTGTLYSERIFGLVTDDFGKWVEWDIYYKPSYSENGRVVIDKDGAQVLDYKGYCAYEGLDSYCKFGLYKWNWKLTPTTVTELITYHKDIEIIEGANIMRIKQEQLPYGIDTYDIKVTSGSGAPATTPDGIGDVYVKTDAPTAIYGSNGTTSSANWKKINGTYTLLATTALPMNPADATTYYWGAFYGNTAMVTWGGTVFRQHIPRAGTISSAYGFISCAAGTNETSSLYLRLNNTTDYLISSTIDNSSTIYFITNSSLNIPVVAGDYYVMKHVTATWATNPTTLMGTLTIAVDL